ncbi:MAG: DnaJ domain-containing protein [Verrucomicrobiota bacterium]
MERKFVVNKNYYVILGVATNASLDDIKSAFRRRAFELHPDRSGSESEPFLELQEAYAVLSDPNRRRRYDDQLEPVPRRRRPWGPAPEPLVTPRRSRAEPMRASPPRQYARELSLLRSFDRFAPSFDELFDRLWMNFENVSHPKSETVESLTVEVILTPEEALAGGSVRIGVPAHATCGVCGGYGSTGPYECWRCEGHGALTAEYPVEVQFPAGIVDGSAMRISLTQFGIENFYLTVLFRVSDRW